MYVCCLFQLDQLAFGLVKVKLCLFVAAKDWLFQLFPLYMSNTACPSVHLLVTVKHKKDIWVHSIHRAPDIHCDVNKLASLDCGKLFFHCLSGKGENANFRRLWNDQLSRRWMTACHVLSRYYTLISLRRNFPSLLGRTVLFYLWITSKQHYQDIKMHAFYHYAHSITLCWRATSMNVRRQFCCLALTV